MAVAFYLEMLRDPSLASVWCEAEDDITLIWVREAGEHVEFVQVKNNQYNQLWSVSILCARDGTGVAPDGAVVPVSILEKSLAHDRCLEPCSFRLITSWQIQQELRVLELPLRHERRAGGDGDIESLVTAICAKAARTPEFRSANDRDAEFWSRNVLWEVRGPVHAVEDANLLLLDELVHMQGGYLAPDQRRDLYDRLLLKAKSTAEVPFDPDPELKKVVRSGMFDFLRGELERLVGRHPAPGGTNLRRKLEVVGIPEDTIRSALRMRLTYRQDRLTPKFLDVDAHEQLEAELETKLHLLRSQLYAGALSDSPMQFHQRCVDAAVAVRDQWAPAVSERLVLGLMYDITERCLHRFSRPSVEELPPSGSPPGALGVAAA